MNNGDFEYSGLLKFKKRKFEYIEIIKTQFNNISSEDKKMIEEIEKIGVKLKNRYSVFNNILLFLIVVFDLTILGSFFLLNIGFSVLEVLGIILSSFGLMFGSFRVLVKCDALKSATNSIFLKEKEYFSYAKEKEEILGKTAKLLPDLDIQKMEKFREEIVLLKFKKEIIMFFKSEMNDKKNSFSKSDLLEYDIYISSTLLEISNYENFIDIIKYDNLVLVETNYDYESASKIYYMPTKCQIENGQVKKRGRIKR